MQTSVVCIKENVEKKNNLPYPIKANYYTFHKKLSSDWTNTNLRLGDVWLLGSNVRLVANSKRISYLKRDQCWVSSEQCFGI